MTTDQDRRHPVTASSKSDGMRIADVANGETPDDPPPFNDADQARDPLVQTEGRTVAVYPGLQIVA